ncbi:M15 family metallopeptidase [Fundidesulfovibrio agrisoli]|uniref:M15 family metallopeptidase n=1 Tax=Fundidesulfovibrio agrisoli TaxID=2922717 RepID=UPI001FAD3783|nr:M15 family metallopeptidase [Fundidesulfovibrio agrisoli]
MRARSLAVLIVLLLVPVLSARDDALPEGFVRLRAVAPGIPQDIRYHGSHNFLGRPVAGYEAPECILSRQAADALKAVADELAAGGQGVLVFDCYRPQRAVEDFVAWSKLPGDQKTKGEFYPNVDKKDFFKLGYVAEKSGHSRGSTVDLTIIPLPAPQPGAYAPGQPLTPCTAPYGQRYNDGGIDMGTGYDCMDEKSHPLTGDVPAEAKANRLRLRELMVKHGFAPYDYEWWHFTLKNEPFPKTYFDFPVTAGNP